jgi:hypothetical protein
MARALVIVGRVVIFQGDRRSAMRASGDKYFAGNAWWMTIGLLAIAPRHVSDKAKSAKR